MTGGAHVIGALSASQAHFCGQNHLVAAAGDGGPKHFLGGAVRVHVGGVEQGHAGLQTQINQPPRFVHAAIAPGAKQRPFAAEGAGAEAQHRYFEAGASQITVFHDCVSLL